MENINQFFEKDKKFLRMLQDFGYKTTEIELKPADTSIIKYNKEKNVFYLIENNVKDDINYLKTINYVIYQFINKYNLKELNIVYLFNIPVSNIILYFLMLSQKFKINFYSDFDLTKENKFVFFDTMTFNIDFYSLEEAEKKNYIKLKEKK